ncbi:MAG TPA: flagellar hook-length control protein FliK [Cellvibrio sp.]|nr:flagellar hook-length control protein FliK [Cellvibrio sp.]
MNNGSLLSSLLGATSANPASGKNTSPKSRVDTSEQFRNALEQARPEVAAAKQEVARNQTHTSRKPDARQPVEHAERRNTAADASKKEKQPLANHAEPRKLNPESRQSVDKSHPESSSTDKTVAAPTHTSATKESSEVVAAELDESILANEDEAISGELLTLVDNSLAVDASELPLGCDSTAEEEIISDLATLQPLDGVLKTPTEAMPVPLMPVLSGNLLPDVDTPESSMEESSALTSIPMVSTVNLRADTNTASAGIIAANTAANTMAPLTDDLAITLEETPTEGVSADIEAQDNPDLFILSGKAAFSKLMDANVTSDKTATPVVDAAKPALTSTSIAEPLMRMTEAQSPAARSFVVQTGLPVAVGQPQWSQAVGEKVLWLAAQNVSAAEIRLDPPDLGPMHVKVTVNQDQANVTFTSPHPIVRDALDQQLNRLREMFAEQGLNLVNVDVSDKSFAQQQQGEEQNGKAGSTDEVEDDLLPVTTTVITSSRLVDHYA